MYVNTISSSRTSKGFSLIEILVTMVILSIGLLGLAGMQVWSFKNATNSNYSTLATFYAYDMAERMRSNKAGARGGAYGDILGSGTDPGCGTNCTSAQVADLHAFEWNSQLQRTPEDGGMSTNALGTVKEDSTSPGVYEIKVVWKEQDISATADDGVASKEFSLRVSL